MAFAPTSVEAYLRQYMKTAGCDVNIDYALHTNRMRVGCKTCHRVYVLTSADVIDWDIQQFVKEHGAGGNHGRGAVTNPADVKPLVSNLGGWVDAKAMEIKAKADAYKQAQLQEKLLAAQAELAKLQATRALKARQAVNGRKFR